MNKIKLFLIALILPLILSSQTVDKGKYSLSKDGRVYDKIIRYVKLNEGQKIFFDESIRFNIDQQSFIYDKRIHSTDTLNINFMNTIEVSSIEKLFHDEFKEHQKKTKLENIKMPPPLSHYNIKVFILEEFNDESIIKYEVDWIYFMP